MPDNKLKIHWGEDPNLWGPRDFFRNSLILREVLRNKKHGRILDFGCGSGNLSLRFVDKGFSVSGIDSSKLVVQYLSKKSKIKIQKGTEDSLFKLKEKFDVVVSGEVLEHLKDDLRAVKGFYKILKKEGVCVVTVPAHQNLWDVNDDYSSHYRRYEKKELIALFEDAGFRIKKAYYFGFPLTYLWHKFVFIPFITERIKSRVINKSLKKSGINISSKLINLLSFPFWIDQLFNFTEKGGGLVLVAEK